MSIAESTLTAPAYRGTGLNGSGGPDAVSMRQSLTVTIALSRWSQMTAWRPEVFTVRPNGCSATVRFDPGYPASLNSLLSSL